MGYKCCESEKRQTKVYDLFGREEILVAISVREWDFVWMWVMLCLDWIEVHKGEVGRRPRIK